MKNDLIICRGGGDLASGIIYTLTKAGYRVLVLEIPGPTTIRRQVAFSSAMSVGFSKVEDLEAKRLELPQNTPDFSAEFREQMEKVFAAGKIPIVADAEGVLIRKLEPVVVIDAILAKRNLGTTRRMAPLTIGIGPGFEAGKDVDLVVETMRGHGLGNILTEGSAYPNTGIPGMVGGYAKERVIHAPADGILHVQKEIGTPIDAGECVAVIENEGQMMPVCTQISGFVRGMLSDGFEVWKGLKMADIDPRLEEIASYNKITDKARCLGASVLQIVEEFSTSEGKHAENV